MAFESITVDPHRMRGLPCIRDTRVTVSAVLGQLAAGCSIDEVLDDYPYLEREDVPQEGDVVEIGGEDYHVTSVSTGFIHVRPMRLKAR